MPLQIGLTGMEKVEQDTFPGYDTIYRTVN